MGTSTSHPKYSIQKQYPHGKIITPENQQTPYFLKTFTTNSKQQHQDRIKYLRQYQKYMNQFHEIAQIVRINEETIDGFCSNSYKVHILLEWSSFTLSKEIKERKNTNRKDALKNYFYYNDLCSILFTSLSAFWVIKTYPIKENQPKDLPNFKQLFISNQKIMIFEDQSIKVANPIMMNLEDRQFRNAKVYYSPEKLLNFDMVDNDKSSIFELGMNLLQASILQNLSFAYNGYALNVKYLKEKLNKGKALYELQIEQDQSFNLFTLIEKMIDEDPNNRPTLQEAIDFAQLIYEKNVKQGQISTNRYTTARFLSEEESKYKQINQNTNDTNAERSNKNRSSQFRSFKNSFVQELSSNIESAGYVPTNQHPYTHQFTTEELEIDEINKINQKDSLQIKNFSSTLNFSTWKNLAFNSINLSDSFIYGENNSKNKSLKTNEMMQQQIFTDPALLRSINRELQSIENRKRTASEIAQMKNSTIIERKSRHSLKRQQNMIRYQ